MHLSRERFSAQTRHCPLLFQKRTIEDLAVSKMRVARDALAYLRAALKGLLRRRNRALGLARHAAALHRLALDLQIALPRFSHLRRIAEHATAFAGEALIAGCSRGFHEIVVSILLRDLVDHARALVKELLLAPVLLHAFKDELHPVYGGVAAPPLRRGDASERHCQGSAKRNSVGRRHAPSLILKCNRHEGR